MSLLEVKKTSTTIPMEPSKLLDVVCDVVDSVWVEVPQHVAGDGRRPKPLQSGDYPLVNCNVTMENHRSPFCNR